MEPRRNCEQKNEANFSVFTTTTNNGEQRQQQVHNVPTLSCYKRLSNMNDRGHHMKLINIPLRPSTLSLLTRRGFHTTADVFHSKKSGIANLAAELEVDLAEAASIGMEVESALKCISCGEESSIQLSNNPMKMNDAPRTAAAILSASIKNANYRPIISFVRSIDSLLGGGFQPHEVTEIVGMPGTGKTQLAMQLCVDAKLPRPFGGVDGDSIYIDSEGSFSPERCHDMAVALVDHLHASSIRSNGQKVVPSNFTVDAILDSIHVFRVYDEASQTATIMGLSDFLERRKNEGKQIKLLVVDSIAFHYRVRCVMRWHCSRDFCLSHIILNISVPLPITNRGQSLSVLLQPSYQNWQINLNSLLLSSIK